MSAVKAYVATELKNCKKGKKVDSCRFTDTESGSCSNNSSDNISSSSNSYCGNSSTSSSGEGQSEASKKEDKYREKEDARGLNNQEQAQPFIPQPSDPTSTLGMR